MTTHKKKEPTDRTQPDAARSGQPVAGNAQFDPAEQSHRRDMDDEAHNGEAGSFRGSASPGSDATRLREQAPAVPMTQKDGG